MKNKKAFAIIELIAVLVILAILALIVTPLVMNIIKKAKDSANKRSIDAYGRSIELAIASHLLETGDFPTSIEELTIEYNGDEVVCETTQLNSDSSVYLAGCTVGGKRVEGYTYGKEENVTYEAYEIGDEVTYNNVDYYVIKDSSSNETNVTLLKENPLTKIEMDNLNLNNITISEQNGYGIVQYGSSTDYSTSTVKQVVDTWKNIAIASGDNATVRLITVDELVDNFGYTIDREATGYDYSAEYTPSWVYNSNYSYWTMTPMSEFSYIWFVDGYKRISCYGGPSNMRMVRPVLEISKSADISMVN